MRLCVVTALLMMGCERPSEVAPSLPTWDRCRTGEPAIRQKFWLARQGTTALGDAGCEWMTVESDGGTRVVRRHRIFGGALTAPDVRVISEQIDSKLDSFEWFDGDGDGRHEFEERETFDDAGVEQNVEQLFFSDAGVVYARTLLINGLVIHQVFLDGGWRRTIDSDAGFGHTHLEIVPIRPPGL
jgi:hypothetical protein